MSKLKRILHVDLDAFFASVEQNEDLSLKGKPVIIGGRTSRGVVATCSYEARKFGIHSAMPTYKARELCPDGVFLSGRYELYSEYSKKVFKILKRYSTKIEKVSIDEAYIDLLDFNESAVIIAREIKKQIKEETGLTISIGISYNKFLAKLASDWEKPDGIFMITPNMIPDLLLDLDIIEIHGLGKKTAEKLYSMNITKIADLYRLSKKDIEFILGNKYGNDIYNKIRGIDHREVTTASDRKSIGVENTLSDNILDRKEIWIHLETYSKSVYSMMAEKSYKCKTLTIKFKYDDFTINTKSKSVVDYISTEKEFLNIMKYLFQSIKFEKRVRLLGVSASNLVKEDKKQLSFIDF